MQARWLFGAAAALAAVSAWSGAPRFATDAIDKGREPSRYHSSSTP